jgi:hypothetical protein
VKRLRQLRGFLLSLAGLVILSIQGCAPIGSIAVHEFGTGFYDLKTGNGESSKVYAEVNEDSLVVYKIKTGVPKVPDPASGQGITINKVDTGNFFFNSTFVKSSIEFDISTILTKMRPPASGVPVQMNANLNALAYIGTRKDYYTLKSHTTVMNRSTSYIKQYGFDVGIFAGIGITPINPTVTNDKTSLEYDGIVFQKGIAAFLTVDYISIGIAVGFDSLIGNDSELWIYHNKPYIGLALGIANF